MLEETTGHMLEAETEALVNSVNCVGYTGVLGTAAPFFAFRGLVIPSPVWYPTLTVDVRRAIFRFVEHVRAAERFDPANATGSCRL